MPLITSVLGARPQFIKAAPLLATLESETGFEQEIIHTGQHYDANMSAVFFEELGIPEPDVNLGVGSGRHGAQTAEMLTKLEARLLQRRPDVLVIYGDTNSTLAGALAAAKLAIPIAHVEAGLRSFNREMPEEINRVLADQLAALLFAPTPVAVNNLKNEDLDEASIFLVGDLMVDAILANKERAAKKSELPSRLGLERGDYFVATVHRQENTDDEANLRAIWAALNELSRETPLILPLHPRTRKQLSALDIDLSASKHLRILDPVGYLDMVSLVSNAALLLTDSGGLQKEAFALGVPCVTLRRETEWVELVEVGANTLTDPADKGSILAAVNKMRAVRVDPLQHALYGQGNTAEQIGEVLGQYLLKG